MLIRTCHPALQEPTVEDAGAKFRALGIDIMVDMQLKSVKCLMLSRSLCYQDSRCCAGFYCSLQIRYARSISSSYGKVYRCPSATHSRHCHNEPCDCEVKQAACPSRESKGSMQSLAAQSVPLTQPFRGLIVPFTATLICHAAFSISMACTWQLYVAKGSTPIGYIGMQLLPTCMLLLKAAWQQ